MEAVTAEYVEARLQAWGRWSASSVDGGLGYPARTMEGRLRAEGGVIIRAPGGRHAEPVDSGAEQMDRIVTRLGAVHPLWPEMLRKYYCASLDASRVADELQCSRAVIKDRWLPMARQRIAGILEGMRRAA